MSSPYFFGYGSLVNRTTHDFTDPQPARLAGWRRVWRHTGLRPVAFLSVVRDRNTVLDGLIAHVPHNDWAALDRREWAYERLPVTSAVTHPLGREIDIAVYAVPPGQGEKPAPSHPVLLSYLDVVVQGYLREFGPAGARNFFATTDGWDAPVLNDRAAPRYPRHRQLESWETRFVDDCLAALSVRILVPD